MTSAQKGQLMDCQGSCCRCKTISHMPDIFINTGCIILPQVKAGRQE